MFVPRTAAALARPAWPDPVNPWRAARGLCHHRGVVTVRDQAAGELATRLASFIEHHRLPGGAAGVVCGDELAWSAAAGFADLGTGRATGPAMLYGIASITKTFTGTAIIQLRDAGRLDLDDPAVRWLPELGSLANPFGPAEAVTIRRMLSHESGLPADPPGTDWTGPTYQGEPEQTLRRAGEIRVQFPPHARHQYSDLAYQWLGEIITRVSGTPYPRYIREAILLLLDSTWVRLDQANP